MIKFLKDEVIEKEEGGIRILFHPVTTSVQSRLIELGRRPGIDKQIDFVQYCLRAVVKELYIDDIELDPLDVAAKSDLSDNGTLKALIKIGQLVDEALIVPEDEKKSSKPLQQPGSKESDVEDAPSQ